MKIGKFAAPLALCLAAAMLTACGEKDNKNSADSTTNGTSSAASESSAGDSMNSDAGNDSAMTGDIDGDGFIEDVVTGAEDIVDDAVTGAEDIIDDILPGESDNNTVTTTETK